MNNSTATQILEALNVGNEGIRYLDDCIQRGELSLSDLGILNNMLDLLSALENTTLDVSAPNRVNEIIANIRYYIERLEISVNDNVNSFIYDFRFHLCSLFRILEFEFAYLVENYINKADYPYLYPEVGNVDHDWIASQGEEANLKVSVVLVGYNNLDYTRDCVESILANTDDVEYELILVDNGSTDGTKEYFDSISGAKVIHLKYNLHVTKGFNIGLMAAEGKYSAAVCNDFIFTPKWLWNLIECIESDSKIGYVSPASNSISNMQQIPIPFISKEDFQEKARKHNVSDPTKWEERVVLLPNVLCCPTALLDRVGYYDTRFFRGEFVDDDISFKIRRAGYKLIYCADTVTHHYGSLTTAADHLTNSLEEGRQTFFEKYKLDAWEEARMQSFYLDIEPELLSGVYSVLGIDSKCGATLLQIKNRIWFEQHVKSELHTLTSNDKYKEDLLTISDKASIFNDFSNLKQKIDKTIDMIFIEEPLDSYNIELSDLFKYLAEALNKEGKLIFTISNGISIESLYNMLNNANSIHNKKNYVTDLVCKEANGAGFELISIKDYAIPRSSESIAIINKLSHSLSSGAQDEINYLNTLLSCSYRLFQMKLKST
jgi:GT2 family glycosyltransferase